MSNRVKIGDIKSKLEEIKLEVDSESDAAKPAALTVGAGLLAASVGVAYMFGHRKAKKQTTVVEVRRV